MDTGREEQIKARAYEIWEQEGRPQGRARDHWEQARREIDGDAASPQPNGKGKTARRSKRATAPNDNPAAATPGFMPGTGSTGDVGDALSPVKRPRKSGTTRKK
ncbi:DUF2934 domain-containing protein [Paramesorhizobium deserti]|uniref:DUF2934 domain-containing protein n=1 Tax=Paramesorhizobium deserti TaxID=1494590 RepID=UPI0009E70B3C|nr:DUF2934 domain-containing protein [Paramesorhizobium deserti]